MGRKQRKGLGKRTLGKGTPRYMDVKERIREEGRRKGVRKGVRKAVRKSYFLKYASKFETPDF